MTNGGSNRTTILVSYSHKEREWLDRLRVHLKPLERTYKVDVWDDTEIKFGSKWKEEIKRAAERARIAILLVSADFLASDFITTDELPPLLHAAENEGAKILPIIVSACRFTRESLSKFQAVNDPSRPLVSMGKGEQEEVFDRMSNLIEASLTSPAASGPVPQSISEYQIRAARARGEQAEEGATTMIVPFPKPKSGVRQTPNNDLGYGVEMGGTYKNATLELVSSEWAKYSDFSWVKSGWLYAGVHSGLSHAVAFFKVHLYDDGRGYVHILDSSNPVHAIWFTTKTGFQQEETFCWSIDPNVQKAALWEFSWK